jgi:NADPH:quinone reductase-like Zn-dependent oxidoreductase
MDAVRALVATPDGPGWTDMREVPEPEPAPDEALVAVEAFAPNRGELELLRTRGEGWRPGQDFAGEVVQAAADGCGPPAGTRVAGLADGAAWAEQVAVPAHRLAPRPNVVPVAAAASLPMAGTTALNLVRRGGSLIGRPVLVTGGSGGVGHLAVQLAAVAGAEVTAVARAEHADRTRSVGAQHVVQDAARAEAGQHLVLESVGGAVLVAALEKVAAGGLVVVFGNSSREPAPLDFRAFAGREARIESFFSHEHERLAADNLTHLLHLAAQARLDPALGLEEDWADVNDVLDGLEARRFFGKAALRVT